MNIYIEWICMYRTENLNCRRLIFLYWNVSNKNAFSFSWLPYIYVICISWKHFDIYLVHVMTAKKFINLLYSFEAPGTAYKKLKRLTSFNNTTLNKRIQKALASWIVTILSLFDFQKIDCVKAPEALNQCLYEYIGYCWALVKQLI